MVALCMDVGLEVYLAVVDVLTSAEFEPHFRTIILLSNNSENVFKCRVPLSVAFPSLFSTLTTSNPEG